MQTFMTSRDMRETARCLDRQRLGKQRVEAIQILRALLGHASGWKNHPATRMWAGHEAYLCKVYLRSIMDEWVGRGYKNDKCEAHYAELVSHPLVRDVEPASPHWLDEAFLEAHRSNLVRKDPAHYKKHFPGVPDDLPYIWP